MDAQGKTAILAFAPKKLAPLFPTGRPVAHDRYLFCAFLSMIDQIPQTFSYLADHPSMKRPAKLQVSVEVPAIASSTQLDVIPSETVAGFVSRAISALGISGQATPFHLFSLSTDFTMVPDKLIAGTLFPSTFRRVVLQPFAPDLRVTVYFEGRQAFIDVRRQTLIIDLVELALQCFNLPVARSEQYLILDSKQWVLCRMDDSVPAGPLILKRADLFAGEVVFSGRITSEMPSVQLFVLAKMLVAPSMKELLSAIRTRRDNNFDFVEFEDSRLQEVMIVYRKGGDGIGAALKTAEMNSLLFLLFASDPQPLLSPALRRFATALMAETGDARRYRSLMLFVLFLPIQTHAMIAEIALTYSSLVGEARENLVRMLGVLLFKESIHGPEERDFVSLLLLCAQWLFGFPGKAGRDLRLHKERLVLVDGDSMITYQGPIEAADLEPFELPKDVPELLAQLPGAPQAEKAAKKVKLFVKLNPKLAQAKQALDTGGPKEDLIRGIAFDRLFATD
jgi:hypothetical protein